MMGAYALNIMQGLGYTMALFMLSVMLGAVISLMLLWGSMSPHPTRQKAAWLCGAVIRGLPELVLIYMVYFGITALLTSWYGDYTEIHPFWAGVLALGALFGAYASQVLRSGLQAVTTGQVQVATTLGLSPQHIFWHVTWPQGLRFALPGLGNLALITLKDTALVSLIGVADITYRAQIAAIQTERPLLCYAIAALLYGFCTVCLGFTGRRLAHVL